MRFWLPAIGLALFLGAHGTSLIPAERPPIAEAVAVKCDHLLTERKTECRSTYEQAFSTGRLDPVATLRAHCTRYTSVWEPSPREAPATCVDHFGGWVES